MFNPQTLVRSTLATALLSALVLAQPAHAGLLGAGAGVGGGLSGGLGSRSLDVGGSAAGQVRRDGGALPRGDKAVQAAGETTQKGREAGAAAATRAAAAKSTTTEKAGTAAAGTTAAGTTAAQGADVSATGSAESSRSEGSVGVGVSAQGSARR